MFESNVLSILLAISSCFFIILVGFYSRMFNVLAKESSIMLSKFVYHIALPAALFISIAENKIVDIINFNFIFAFFVVMLIVYVGVFIFAHYYKKKNPAQSGILALAIALPNTAYIGIPILTALVGMRGVAISAIATVLLIVIMMIAIINIESERSKKNNFFHNVIIKILPLIKNPLIIATIIGVIFSFYSISIPKIFEIPLKQLGATTSTCALFAIGQALFGKKLINGDKITFFLLCFAKLILQPILMLSLIYLFHMPSIFQNAGFILSALPAAAIVFIVAQRYGVYEEKVTSIIFATTLGSIITIPLVVLIANRIFL